MSFDKEEMKPNKWKLCLVLVIVFDIIIVRSLHLPSSHQFIKRDYVNLHITDPSHIISSSHRTRRHAEIPDQLHITAEGSTFRKSFSLEMFQPEDKYFPVYLNGVLHTYSSLNKLQTHYYRCVNHECLFHAEKIISHNGSALSTYFRLFGTFHVDGQLHVLETISDNQHIVIVPDVPKTMQYDNYRVSQYNGDQSNRLRGQKRSRQRRATGSYQVELLMVVDYSAFQFWMKEKNDVRKEAIEAIKQFYAFMIKGVNLRYQNLPGSSYSLTVRNAGLYIIEDATSASFLENIKTCQQSNTRCTLDAQGALSAFMAWAGSTSGIPSNDHAMLFTRYDVGLQSKTSPTGYAYTGKICSSESYSLVEEDFNFISQTIAAHELAHSLNAVHDGVQNACSEGERNIMSAVSSAISGSLAQNPWKFSSCTAQEINNKLNEVVNSNNNCLQSIESSNPPSLDPYLSNNIGQDYSPDIQCRMVLGDTSFACRNIYATERSYGSVCTGLWCNNPSLTDKCSLILPAERTSCGNKKWCEGYQCISSSQAPAVSDNCVFGDQIGSVANSLTCSSLISQQSLQCYNDAVQQRCCASCKSAATGISDCEYGDRLDCSNINRYGCYSNNNGVDCCNTCRPYITTIQNCQFGDRSADCSALTHGSQCYGNNADICCQTCHQYKTGISGCEYGDRANNCKVNLCTSYTETDRNSCCETCNGVTTEAPTTPTTEQTKTNNESSQLPEWVIPTAAGAGGLLLIVLVIIIICCLLKSRRTQHDTKPRQRRVVEQPRYQVSQRERRHAPQGRRMSRTVILQHPNTMQHSRGGPSRGGHLYVNNGYDRY